jgi:hypothetical protein
MANQVAARLAGDDYQHLYAWWHALELLNPRSDVVEVLIEDEGAGSFDDVTVHYDAGSRRAGRFYQVKYHVDQRNTYSTDVLLDRSSGSSLLQKFWRTSKKLDATGRDPQLVLFSNWSWDSADALGSCIDGRDGSLKPDFLSAGPRSELGKLRERWLAECAGSLQELSVFAGRLQLRLGSTNAAADVGERVAERMRNWELQDDESALHVAAGIVRDWIKKGIQRITKAELEGVLASCGLYVGRPERSVTVYLETIKKRRFELEPDYLLDWRENFSGSDYERSHRVVDQSLWNRTMLPELQHLEERVNRESAARLIRARGLARLSAWFAFGHIFSRVAGYEIEIQQGGALWRTDAPASQDFKLVATSTPPPQGRGAQLAIGLSVTGSLVADVRTYLNSIGFSGLILELEPERGPSREVFRHAGDAVAFAAEAKKAIRQWIDTTQANELLVFYFGPLSGACFLGHDLNAIGAHIIIMEDQAPGYARAFELG